MILNYLNALVCTLIAIRLFVFNRDGYKYKLSFGLLAWAMICSSLAIAMFSCFNFIERVYIAQTMMNCLILVCVFQAHGNVSKICAALKTSYKFNINTQNKQ